jgi:hypothetical protein
MKPNCTHCKHYSALEDSGMVLDYGVCRRHPPVPLVDADGDTFTTFPQVDEQDVCGEWGPKQ